MRAWVISIFSYLFHFFFFNFNIEDEHLYFFFFDSSHLYLIFCVGFLFVFFFLCLIWHLVCECEVCHYFCLFVALCNLAIAGIPLELTFSFLFLNFGYLYSVYLSKKHFFFFFKFNNFFLSFLFKSRNQTSTY